MDIQANHTHMWVVLQCISVINIVLKVLKYIHQNVIRYLMLDFIDHLIHNHLIVVQI